MLTALKLEGKGPFSLDSSALSEKGLTRKGLVSQGGMIISFGDGLFLIKPTFVPYVEPNVSGPQELKHHI